jgi:DNA modification methylase
LVVAEQLKRHAVGIEIDPKMVEVIRWRLNARRPADRITLLRNYYRFTPDLDTIWPDEGLFG